MNSISICIPLHDPKNEFFDFIQELVESICCQTVLPDEIIISANHSIEYLNKLQNLASKDIKIKFVQNNSISSAENTNFAVAQSNCEIVKIMHQDDFFSTNLAIEKILENIKNKAWQASAFDHLHSEEQKIINPLVPKLSRSLIFGYNRIGAPSVVAFRRKNFLPFDKSMHYLFDCDWYLKMWHKWGKPTVLKDHVIRIRIHEGQATNWASKNLFEEMSTTKKNHRKSIFHYRIHCECTKNLLN